jgi:hypothetical protein
MKRDLTLQRTCLLSVLALSITCLIVLSARTSSTGQTLRQNQERLIKQKSWKNEPVKISKLKIKGKGFAMGQKFLEEDDWLKNLTISVKNVSGKNITFLSLTLDFPKPEDSTEVPAAFSIEYGRNPLFPANVVWPDSLKPIADGETKDLTLSDTEYSTLRDLLSETNYPASIKRMDIILGDIVFDDGTKWSGGAWFRRDSNDPTRWKDV